MLKPLREELAHELSFYLNEVAEPGGVVSILTTGSGGGYKTNMNDTLNVCTYAAVPSGKVALGFLGNAQALRSTRYGLTDKQGFKDEMAVGQKCTIIRRGNLHTNFVVGSPVGGQTAYLAASGYISPTSGTGVQAIGMFLSSKDENGYARVSFNFT